ncbi:THO complex subunit 3-like [Dysidea avara]|uniref:THO complex subunit 3-like n=1 Tax=Dysidea avara TaxID=196820 RepID=UPI003322F4E6
MFREEIENLRSYFEANKRKKDFIAHQSKVHSVDWSCDGQKLASGSYDKTVSVFTLDKDRLSKDSTYKGHNDSVDQLCWHPTDPQLLVTASIDKTIRIWDIRTSKSTHTVTTRGENINIKWSPNGNTIAVGNKEDLLTFVDSRTYKIINEEQFKYEVNEMTWNHSNDMFFLTNGIGCINILSYPDLKQLHVLNAHASNCICIKFHPSGKYFATGSADALVSLWDVDELVCIRTFSRLDWPIRAMSFNHDGKLIASSSEDLVVDIAHVETGEKIAEVPCQAPTFTVAWHPTKNLLAFAGEDKDKHERDAGTVWLFGIPSSS